MQNRVGDLLAEIDLAIAHADAGEFAQVHVVVDFWRTRGDWFVQWGGALTEGSNTVGKGNYGFDTPLMVEELLDGLAKIAADHKPATMVIGHRIDRMIATEGGEGIAPEQFERFVEFYAKAAARVRQASPETRVGSGFHWDNVVSHVAEAYADGGPVDEAAIDRAFTAVLLPIARQSDIVALESYTSVAAANEQGYQYLRRLPARHGLKLPVVWYSVGSPVTSKVEYVQQRVYLERFRKWNAGVPVDLVSWRMLANFDGADTSDQVIRGRCAAIIAADKQFLMAKSYCFDGLLTSLQAKPVFDFIDALAR